MSAGTLSTPGTLPQVTRYVHAPPCPLPSSRRLVSRFLRSEQGRVATLKLLQYILRLTVYIRQRTLPSNLAIRLLAIVSSLAAIRRALALYSLLDRLRTYTPWRLRNRASVEQHVDQSLPPDPSFSLLRSLLDTVSTLLDSTYLFTRLRLLPLSPRTAKRVDQLSDLAALCSAAAGIAQVAKRRRELYELGRGARRRAVEADQRLEELEFWEGTKSHQDMDKVMRGYEDRMTEEKRLREEVRRERKHMQGFREELGKLRWERVKVSAEGLFALYNTLNLQNAAVGTKAWSGIASSGIEFYQAWAGYLALAAAPVVLS
ncbi:hypothetical protein JCM11641_005785 [Rhodosporidiobolus odoratus]